MNGLNIKLRTIDYSKNFTIRCPNIFKSKFFGESFSKEAIFFCQAFGDKHTTVFKFLFIKKDSISNRSL